MAIPLSGTRFLSIHSCNPRATSLGQFNSAFLHHGDMVDKSSSKWFAAREGANFDSLPSCSSTSSYTSSTR